MPAEVKEGVKNYFKTIQEKPEAKKEPEPVNKVEPKKEEARGGKKAAA